MTSSDGADGGVWFLRLDEEEPRLKSTVAAWSRGLPPDARECAQKIFIVRSADGPMLAEVASCTTLSDASLLGALAFQRASALLHDPRLARACAEVAVELSLTPRRLDVVALAASGLTRRADVADRLGISEDAVRQLIGKSLTNSRKLGRLSHVAVEVMRRALASAEPAPDWE